MNIQMIIFTCSMIGLFTAVKPGFTQDESLSDTTVHSIDSATSYITPLEYAFMMHEETSWLFKGDILSNVGRFYLKIGIEKRIAPNFTLNLSVDQSIHEDLVENNIANGISTALESRWYYRLNKRVKVKKVARNMSDNYVAFGLDYTYLLINKDISEHWQPDDNNFLTLYVKWGLQRRFLKQGHADIGVKLGVTNPATDFFSHTPSLVFATYVDLGLAFAKDKYKLDYEKLCPVLKCYESTNHIFKSNLSSLFNINLNRYNFSFHISPHIAFERKIGHSPLSINSELYATYSFTGYSSNKSVHPDNLHNRPNTHEWNVNALLEIRYYYNLQRRILKGKTGNGLSANYVAMGGSYHYENTNYNTGYFMPDIYVSTGWQRVFGKHFYFDINIGCEYNFEVLNTYGYNVQLKGFEPRFRIAVGYRF